MRQVIGSAHGNVHAQFFQHCGVFGVVHPGHRALDLEHLLCKLAYDQIVFVPARYRNHGAAVSHVRTFLHFGKSAVAAHHGQVQAVGHLAAHGRVVLDEHRRVAVLQKGLGKIVAHFAAAHDTNTHIFVLLMMFPRMGRYPRRREYSSVRQFRKQDLIIHMQRRLGVGKFHRAVGAQHAEYHHARPGRLYGRKRTVPLMLRSRYS